MYNSQNKNKVKKYKKYLNEKQIKEISCKIFSNKKKIRNWSTLVNKLNDLISYYRVNEQNRFTFLSDLKRYKRECMKLYISPFCDLEKRNPPLWYRKLFLKALFELYDNWQAFAKQYLHEPYYLKIWMFEPDFYDSQIVLGIGDRIKRFEHEAFEETEYYIPFPHKTYNDSTLPLNTHEYSWDFKNCIHVYRADEVEYFDRKYINKLFKQSKAHIVRNKNTEDLLIIQGSNVWVGGK